MAREIMNTQAVAEHFSCTPRQARKFMREIGLIDIGHGYVYRDALEHYEAVNADATPYTLPVLQQDYPTRHPRYRRERRPTK